MNGLIAINDSHPADWQPERGKTVRFYGADGRPVVALVVEVDAAHRLARLDTQNREVISLPFDLLAPTWEGR